MGFVGMGCCGGVLIGLCDAGYEFRCGEVSDGAVGADMVVSI